MVGCSPEHGNQLLPCLISRGDGVFAWDPIRTELLCATHVFLPLRGGKIRLCIDFAFCRHFVFLRSAEELPFQQLRSQIPAVRGEGVLVYQPPLVIYIYIYIYI